MAPNRKSLSALAQSIDVLDLVNTVQPKYFLPLTHPLEASSCQAEEVSPAAHQDSYSYWEWSSDDCVLEPTVCVLSSDNIVSNLIQAGNAFEEEHGCDINHEHDDYWSEGAQPQHVRSPRYTSMRQEEPMACDVASTLLDSDDYWSWQSSCPSRVAELVMATQHGQQLPKMKKHMIDAVTLSHEYWAW